MEIKKLLVYMPGAPFREYKVGTQYNSEFEITDIQDKTDNVGPSYWVYSKNNLLVKVENIPVIVEYEDSCE